MQRQNILLAVVIAGAVLAGSWFFIAAPKREEARKIDEQIASSRADLAGASARAAQYKAARDRLRKHPEVFEKAGKALPNRVSMPDLLRTLTKTARGTGVTMGELTTADGGGGAASMPGINSVGLQMSFTGDFLALRRYLERLQRFVAVTKTDVAARGRLVALNTVHLKPADGGLLADVTATVYTLQPGALAAGATATSGTTGTTPAGSAAAGSTSPAPANGTAPAAPAPGAPAASTSTPAGGA